MDTLTLEQKSVIDKLLLGHNIALLGAAGCGKSYLLSVVSTLPKKIQMCALTGCAALLLGHKAKTVHSWAGIGLGKADVSELYKKIRKNGKSMRNWLSTDLLIIDEISMMTAELLDKLDELAKKIRSDPSPFGGIQLLLVGDFFQLPPINVTKFAFESEIWKTMITIELTQIMRQKEETFQKILKEARIGEFTQESCNILSSRQGLPWKKNKIRPTLLFPKRSEVDIINETNLRALTGKKYTYNATLIYDGKIPNWFNDEIFQNALQLFDSNAPYNKELELILNAQVMLIANIAQENGLVNGSRGVIVGFDLEQPVVEFLNGVTKTIGTHAWPIEEYEFISRSQIPLRLAYASTIHKMQGATLDSALVDIGSAVFEYGQAYVALSRVRSLESLYVYDFSPVAFKAHPKVKEFHKQLAQGPVGPVELGPVELGPVELVEPELVELEQGPVGPVELEQGPEEQGPESDNWLYDSIPIGWKDCLLPCKDTLLKLSTFLNTRDFFPSKENIWNALIPMESIKVVILGQDPYPTPGNAHGLAFSVLPNVPIPLSLKNIYKELESDGFIPPTHGNLEKWSTQGVMLLNTVLTIDSSQSHFKIGWEEVTDHIIRSIPPDVIFVLWGKHAQLKKKILNHTIIESSHPSPLSAYRGFFGSKPFSTINDLLKKIGKEPIIWNIVV